MVQAAGFPYAGTYIGSDEVVKNVHGRLGTELEGYSAKDDIYTFNDNIVIAYGKYSGTYKATGKSFVADYFDCSLDYLLGRLMIA